MAYTRYLSFPRKKIHGINLIPNGGNYNTWYYDFSDANYGLPYLKRQIDYAELAGANCIGWIILPNLAASNLLGLPAMTGMVTQIAQYIAAKGLYSYPKLQILDAVNAGQTGLALALLQAAAAPGLSTIGMDMQNEANGFSLATMKTAYQAIKAVLPWLSVGVSFAPEDSYSTNWGNASWSNGLIVGQVGQADHFDVHYYASNLSPSPLNDPYTLRGVLDGNASTAGKYMPVFIGETGVALGQANRVGLTTGYHAVLQNTDVLGGLWWASVPQNEAPVPGALTDYSPSGQRNYGNSVWGGSVNNGTNTPGQSDGGNWGLTNAQGAPYPDIYNIFTAFDPTYARARRR